jgi:hypothetical protein
VRRACFQSDPIIGYYGIDLSSEFSEGFQQHLEFDATVDARIDAAKEARV